jgi:hypothetical protein
MATGFDVEGMDLACLEVHCGIEKDHRSNRLRLLG